MAGTPSSSGGASERPSVSERCDWAAAAAESAVALRVVGTGGSFAGNCGVTVRWGVVVVLEEAGFAAVEEVVLVVAALGGVALYAALMREEDNVRVCNLYANGVVFEEETLNKADMPLCVGLAAMVCMFIFLVG